MNLWHEVGRKSAPMSVFISLQTWGAVSDLSFSSPPVVNISDIRYHVMVKTGNVSGASSDSKVHIKLYGEKGDTSKQSLVTSDNDLGNYFEQGQVDVFIIDTMDIGTVSIS